MDYRISSTAGPGGEVYRPANSSGYPHISYGLPFHIACKKHVAATFQASRIYLIASASLSKNTSYVKLLQSALGDKLIATRYGIKPHTLWSEILSITSEASSLQTDLIITLGAGSLTDGAKIISLAIANNAETFSDLDSLHSGSDWSKKRPDLQPPKIPIISIPTSLSGGEYSFLGGGTNDNDNVKYGFGHPCIGPALVILDPELTTTTPDSIWLQSGIRAIDHCVEGLCSLQATKESDEVALAGLRLLVPGLSRCKASKEDLEARHDCQMGVIQAMKVVFEFGVPMGASHGIGHQLGPLGVGHGETSCILLPAVCKYNEGVNLERQKKVVEVFWEDEKVAKGLADAGLEREDATLSDVLDVYTRSLGMPRSLRDVGIEGEEKMNLLAENSLKDKWCGTNPRALKRKEDVLEILEMVRG
ncbi:Dehydrogenase FUM7 [Pseudocercospora fuligena]|uniref:Dehydrogenase FUM7 n=1 Tax=Pseudocercospora fuligena TaxID=685502 RepID=A0A8H6RJE1_9PEZI|nr:Dehydrogenase FUM7 [Pseudocercospora fuligena]